MDILSLVKMWWQAQLVMTTVALTMSLVGDLRVEKWLPVSKRHLLKMHYAMIAVSLFGIFYSPNVDRPLLRPAAQIWSAPTFKSHKTVGPERAQKSDFVISTPLGQAKSFNRYWLAVPLLINLLLSLSIFLRVVWSQYKIIKLIHRSFILHSFHKVKILFSNEIDIPFALRLMSRYVVIPNQLLNRHDNMMIAIKHELQHHRQLDTVFNYLLVLLRALFVLNPFVHLWLKRIYETQELACDEALIGRNKVPPQAMGHCLLDLVETALHRRSHQLGFSSMALGQSGQFLRRRICFMLTLNQRSRFRGLISAVVFTVTVSLCSGLIFIAQASVSDYRIDLEEARLMASRVESDFPIIINDRVLKQLNRYLATEDGRKFMREGLARMKNYEELLSLTTKKYNAPPELRAIGLIESGFQNLPASQNPYQAAGIWQFIPTTARAYNLRVDETVDERLDIDKETDAAFRYLTSLYLRFQDWNLASLSYNVGENRVQRGIYNTGSRDPWTLIKHGYGGQSEYLAKLIAAILIMENPESLQ